MGRRPRLPWLHCGYPVASYRSLLTHGVLSTAASYGNGRLVALLVWGDANTSGIGVLLARDDAYAELVQLVKLGRVRVSHRRLRAMVMSA